MAVGYGYIRDAEPTQVDWGQITKDARESIKSIEKDRQARRDKIDENYREFTKMLAERPVGGDTQYQAFMGKYSALVSASMLANLGKLKRGEIGEQQYNTCRATVTSGAEGMIATGKAYIAGHDTAAALQVGNGSAMTKYSNEQSQKLFSLEGVEPMIDPATCETSYAIVGEDGEKEIVDVTQGLRRAVATQAAFDATGLIERILKNAPLNDVENSLGGKEEGQFLKQITVGGKTQIVVDTDYIRTQVKAAVQQNSHVFDILKLNKTGYEIVALPDAYYALTTQEERDAMLSDLQKKTKNLYVDKSDTPLVSEAQRLEAENFLVEQVKSGAQRRSKATPYKAEELIIGDLGYQEAATERITHELEQSGVTNSLAEVKNFAESFFVFGSEDNPEVFASDLEGVFKEGLGAFNFRNISFDGELLTFYSVEGDDKYTVDISLTDRNGNPKTPSQLQQEVALMAIDNAGFNYVVQKGLISGALSDASGSLKPGELD